jgi:hypothetical protein
MNNLNNTSRKTIEKFSADNSKFKICIFDFLYKVKTGKAFFTDEKHTFFRKKQDWTNSQKSKFIECLLFGSIVNLKGLLHLNTDGTYTIIDGTQRIRAIKEFLANEFRLEGMEILTELNGKLYSELDAYIQATIDDTEMDFECITPSTDRKIVAYLISKLH